ncbi:hypothetical protein [Streptomyces aureocirculatus]|uniref:hypothetical protein n=1 Tax=Streptomyces aureocirculatus TaxID=67275 RepID=UPI000A731E39|nr:hypothetical protein [Streptomyces aureocirculatus]
MDITTQPSAKGIHIVRTIGDQKWAEDHGTWKVPGVRLDLRDGRQLLAVCKLEVAAQDAEERAKTAAAEIEPWVTTLHALAIVDDQRSKLAAVESLVMRIEEEEAYGWVEPTTLDELFAYAHQSEIDAMQKPGCSPLGVLITARVRGQISRGLRLALAHAPSPDEAPIHPAWEQPPIGELSGEPTVQRVARDLLAAWADVRDARDPLITWAVQGAGLERTAVQQITKVARTTINRMLP